MNIILQHWDGPLNELTKLSIDNISKYAKSIGADYQCINGKPFRKHLSSPCQKVFCIDANYDSYNQVLMLDPDVFVVKDLNKNIFDEEGNGVHEATQKRLKGKLVAAGRIGVHDPYWAGSIYKFTREERIALRKAIPKNDSWMDFYNKAYHFEDEGILAELASKAKLPVRYLDFKWNQCSFLPTPQEAFMIHIRTKLFGRLNGTWENGGKRPKIENYKQLKAQGII